MQRSFLVLIFIAMSLTFLAQSDSAYRFYRMGLQAFNEKNYLRADSMYTISAEMKQHPDTYYNRALTRIALNNVEGYCEDLCFGAIMGDKECDTLFRRECGTADTTYTDIKNNPATRLKHHYYSILYQSNFKNANLGVKYDLKGKFVASHDIKKDTTAAPLPDGDMVPEYPGGNEALQAFINTNLKYPAAQLNSGVTGLVTVRFAINRFGYIENIKVTKPLEACPQCSREAVRLVSAMPRWKPASSKGKPVRVFSNLPLLFKPKK